MLVQGGTVDKLMSDVLQVKMRVLVDYLYDIPQLLLEVTLQLLRVGCTRQDYLNVPLLLKLVRFYQ